MLQHKEVRIDNVTFSNRFFLDLCIEPAFTEAHFNSICDCTVKRLKDKDNKDEFLRFPDGLRWGSSATSYLFERREYNNMLQLIENALAHYKIAFVRGTPGIGISLFGWWLLYNLISDAVVEKKSVTILFASLADNPVLLSVDQNGNRSHEVVPTFYTGKIIDYLTVNSKDVGGTSTVGKYKIFISSNGNPHYDNAITNWGFKGPRIFGKLVMNPFSLDEICAFASDGSTS